MFDLPIQKKIITKKQQFLKIKKSLELLFPGEYNIKLGVWNVDELKPNETKTINITVNTKHNINKLPTPTQSTKDVNIEINSLVVNKEDKYDVVLIVLTLINNTEKHIKNTSIQFKLPPGFKYISNTGKSVYTKMLEFGKEKQYYVVTKQGYRIIPNEYRLNKKTVMLAWKTTLQYINTNKQVVRNDDKFSEHKQKGDSVMNKLLTQQ